MVQCSENWYSCQIAWLAGEWKSSALEAFILYCCTVAWWALVQVSDSLISGREVWLSSRGEERLGRDGIAHSDPIHHHHQAYAPIHHHQCRLCINMPMHQYPHTLDIPAKLQRCLLLIVQSGRYWWPSYWIGPVSNAARAWWEQADIWRLRYNTGGGKWVACITDHHCTFPPALGYGSKHQSTIYWVRRRKGKQLASFKIKIVLES